MTSKSYPLTISCGILQKEIEKLIEENNLKLKTCFLDAGLNVVYYKLEKEIKSAIEKAKILQKMESSSFMVTCAIQELKKLLTNTKILSKLML